MLRLLFLSTEFPPGPGGIGTQAFHLAHVLSSLEWEVVVITPQDYASEEEIEQLNSAQSFRIVRQQHHENIFFEGAGRFGNLFRVAREFRPDILLASGARAVWLAALYGRLSHSRWVAIAHGGIEFGTPIGWQRATSRWAYSQPDAVVCVSEYARRRLLDFGARASRIVVIPNGADEGVFHPVDPKISQAFRREWDLEQSKIILTVGSLTERKGQETVIRALPLVLQHQPSVHYMMAGLPQIREKLERLANELGVRQQVHFLDRVEQATLVAAYNACDVFVMTSRHSTDGDSEGFGIAVIEAALCGKPAVVSSESGLAEAVIHEQTGLLALENDHEAVAEAILKILSDDALRARMGQQARDRAVQQTWSSRTMLYDCLLREILGA